MLHLDEAKKLPVFGFGTKVANLSVSIFLYKDHNSKISQFTSVSVLVRHNFTLGLLPIYIVHINENNQRLVNSYDPNIFINMTRKAPKDTMKEIRFTFFFSIAKVKAVVS